jgi:hypothetical protein
VVRDDGRARRVADNQRLKDSLDLIVGASDPEKRQRATDTASHIMGLTPEQLEARSPTENVLAMAALTSVNRRITIDSTSYREETPEPQMAALAKLYENMKLDPDFEEQDRTQRSAILDSIANVGDAQKMAKVNWKPGHGGEDATTSGDRLRHLQGLQTAHLPPGMLGPSDQLRLVASLDSGQSGVCRGKQVQISSDTEVNHSFDETLNTVVHETTHAYQKHLTDTIDSIPLDDPRYVQTQLFKFNNRGYANPPDKLGRGATSEQQEEYERLYKAYKNQPVERHAWQAGNEAGRLFDSRAGALASVETAQHVARFAPNSSDEAQTLAGRIGTGNNQQKSAAMLELDVLAEQAIGLASDKISKKQQDDNCVTFIGVRAWNDFERRRVAVLNDRRSKPAQRLTTLDTLMDELDVAYESGRAREAIKTEIDTVSSAITAQLKPPNVVTWLTARRWNAIEAERHRLATSTADPASRLRLIQELKNQLGPEIEIAAASKAIVDLMKPKDTVALLGGAEHWNKLEEQRVELHNNQRVSELVALKNQVSESLTKARAAEQMAETEFERLWAVLTKEALPSNVHAVAVKVKDLKPRSDAVAMLKSNQDTVGYFQRKGVTL